MQLELGELTQRLADEFPDGLGQFADDKKAEASAEVEALKATTPLPIPLDSAPFPRPFAPLPESLCHRKHQ